MWFAVFYCYYYTCYQRCRLFNQCLIFHWRITSYFTVAADSNETNCPLALFFLQEKTRAGQAIIPKGENKITCLNETRSFKSKAGSSIKARLSSLIHISSFFDSLFHFLLRFIVSFSCYSVVVCTQLDICDGSKDTQMKCIERLMPLYSAVMHASLWIFMHFVTFNGNSWVATIAPEAAAAQWIMLMMSVRWYGGEITVTIHNTRKSSIASLRYLFFSVWFTLPFQLFSQFVFLLVCLSLAMFSRPVLSHSK